MKGAGSRKEKIENSKKGTHAMTAGPLDIPTRVCERNKSSASSLWHMRLGHAPMRSISQIEGLSGLD